MNNLERCKNFNGTRTYYYFMKGLLSFKETMTILDSKEYVNVKGSITTRKS